MNIREQKEEFEEKHFNKYAAKSAESLGRERYEEPCEIRTCYQKDRDKILHCKSFRRLKHKTQVFLSPSGDHYRTRLTHTLEVSQIARTIATCLWLNEDLTEAIALGHDLGHTPFGHAGERTLNRKHKFKHNIQSLRVVEILEKEGAGLNLCAEVKDGILNHGLSGNPNTLEGQVVRLADKIAYTNHDMDDAIRAGILSEGDVPKDVSDVIGKTHGERLDFLIKDVIRCSEGQSHISMSDKAWKALSGLRNFLTDNLYFNPVCKSEEAKADLLLETLYDYYISHPGEIPEEYRKIAEMHGICKERIVCDYISGMTDNYSVDLYKKLFVPEFWGM